MVKCRNTSVFLKESIYFDIEMNRTNLLTLAMGKEQVFRGPVAKGLLQTLLRQDHHGLGLGNPGQKCVILLLGQ